MALTSEILQAPCKTYILEQLNQCSASGLTTLVESKVPQISDVRYTQQQNPHFQTCGHIRVLGPYSRSLKAPKPNLCSRSRLRLAAEGMQLLALESASVSALTFF